MPARVERPAAVHVRTGQIGLLIGMLLMTAAAPAADGDRKAKGRSLLTTFGPAVVRVTATFRNQGSKSGIDVCHEGGTEAIGTVIDPTGIVVVSGFVFNQQQDPDLVSVAGNVQKIETQTAITKPVIHLADGTEVPARLALVDPDLGLLFVVPAKADERRFVCVPLPDGSAGATADVQPLDEAFTLSHHGAVFGYEPTVRLTRITAVQTKPRVVYTVAEKAAEEGAVFDSSGRFIGVQSILSSSSDPDAYDQSVVIPATGIAEGAKQVRERKPAPVLP